MFRLDKNASTLNFHIGEPVIYIPKHIQGLENYLKHDDAEVGTVQKITNNIIFVIFPPTPTPKGCSPEDLAKDW